MIARIFRNINNTMKNGAPNVRIKIVAGARPGRTNRKNDTIPAKIPTTMDNGNNTIFTSIAAKCSTIFILSLQADNHEMMGNTLFCRAVANISDDTK